MKSNQKIIFLRFKSGIVEKEKNNRYHCLSRNIWKTEISRISNKPKSANDIDADKQLKISI